MKTFTSENKIFLSLYLAFLVVGGALIYQYEKGSEILYINSFHQPFLDSFFIWVTKLAESPALLLILLYVTFSGFGNGLLLSLNIGAVFTLTTILKKLVFDAEVRPSVFFEGKAALHFADGLEIARYHSFPSGHTAAGFAVFFMLSLFLRDKKWSVVFFFIALLIGVSRVYLLQHFFRDVYFGSVLAVTITVLVWLTVAQSKFYNNLSWKDKAILK